jgi:hypothetical protein
MPITLTERLNVPKKKTPARMGTENQSLLGPGTIDLSVVILTAGCDWPMVKSTGFPLRLRSRQRYGQRQWKTVSCTGLDRQRAPHDRVGQRLEV